MRARTGRHSKPSCREYSQHVPVSKQSRVAVQRTHSCDHTIDARADLLWSFCTSWKFFYDSGWQAR
jgi:hypothetical protein